MRRRPRGVGRQFRCFCFLEKQHKTKTERGVRSAQALCSRSTKFTPSHKSRGMIVLTGRLERGCANKARQGADHCPNLFVRSPRGSVLRCLGYCLFVLKTILLCQIRTTSIFCSRMEALVGLYMRHPSCCSSSFCKATRSCPPTQSTINLSHLIQALPSVNQDEHENGGHDACSNHSGNRCTCVQREFSLSRVANITSADHWLASCVL